jgi:4-hydroxy-4-methyl-2-oxoglutarate aldolase
MADDASVLIQLGTATLGECGATPLRPSIRPVWPGAAFAGPARTAWCADGDNLAVHAALARAVPGAVLAVSCDGDASIAVWGEVLTVAAQAGGLAAAVIDGAVRDVAAIGRLRFPAFARGVAVRGPSKTGPGAVGEPVRLGGELVRPGDWLVGDDDGVVVIPAGQLARCRDAAAARAEREAAMMAALRAGASTAELLGLDLSPLRSAE